MIRRTKPKTVEEIDDSKTVFVSTGSTLLDLAISGGRRRGGGIPSGILVEVFGPSSTGKTVLLCEIAGQIQRLGGEVKFNDPESRLNKQFARIFGFELADDDYEIPATVVDVFKPIQKWEPKGPVNGYFADSLAALTTEMEMENESGDKMGMRRAKEFSEQCRKTCRIITDRNILMVCSNQVRMNLDAGPYGQKYKTPGGEAIGFYASLRLQCKPSKKIQRHRKISGEKVSRVVGVETEVYVYKSSVWKPFRDAPITILFDYGLDDIRGNLQFIKDTLGGNTYAINGEKLDVSLDDSIAAIESGNREKELKEQVIDLWSEVEEKFAGDESRKRKHE